jgi:integrase/recombinase XerD
MSRVTAFKVLKKTMGLNPHSMRHHFATHMIINGADVSVVSDLLGHSNLITTQIYTHIKKTQLANTVKAYHPMSEEYAHAV